MPHPTRSSRRATRVLAARGTCVDGAMVQAKGRNYRLDDLVADEALAKTLTGGAYATITCRA